MLQHQKLEEFEKNSKKNEKYKVLPLKFCVKTDKKNSSKDITEHLFFFSQSLLPGRIEQVSLHNDAIHLLVVTVHDDVTANPAHS